MKNLKVEVASKTLNDKNKELFMTTLVNKQVIESSSLFLDLSESLLKKFDLYFSNTNLNEKQQKELMKLFYEVYSEGYVNCIAEN